MSRATLIPRRDHESYFVELAPANPRSRRDARKIAENALRELHPGFSSDTAFDARVVRTRERRFLLVTAMERRELEEYRLARSFCRLATATSAIVADARFLELPVSAYGDELIGYIAERDEPVSVPMTDAGAGAPRGIIDVNAAANRSGAAVFRRVPRAAAFGVVALAMSVALVVFSTVIIGEFSKDSLGARESLPIASSATVIEPAALPEACRTLVDFASALRSANGCFDEFRYDEASERPVRATVSGCDPIELRKVLADTRCFTEIEFGRIEIDGGIPRFSIAFSFRDAVFPRATVRASERAFLSVALDPATMSADFEDGVSNGLSFAFGASRFCGEMESFLGRLRAADTRLSSLTVRVIRDDRSFTVEGSIAEGASGELSITESDLRSVADAAGFPAVAKKASETAKGPRGSEDRVGAIVRPDGRTALFVKNGEGKITVLED